MTHTRCQLCPFPEVGFLDVHVKIFSNPLQLVLGFMAIQVAKDIPFLELEAVQAKVVYEVTSNEPNNNDTASVAIRKFRIVTVGVENDPRVPLDVATAQP